MSIGWDKEIGALYGRLKKTSKDFFYYSPFSA